MADQNAVKVVESSQGQFRLNLSKADIAKVDVVDVDFVIQTKSGERIILPGAAIDATGDKPPAVVFNDGQISTSQLFSSVAQVQNLDVPVPAMSSLNQYEAQKTKGPRSFVSGEEGKGATGASGEAAAAATDAASLPAVDTSSNVAPLAQPVPTTVETLMQSAKQDLSGISNKSGDFTVPPAPLSSPSASAAAASSSKGAQPTVPQLPTLYVWEGNITGSVTSGTTVYGAGGSSASDPRSYVAATALATNSPVKIAPEELSATGGQTVYVDGAGSLRGGANSVNVDTTYAVAFVASLVGTYNTAGNMKISGVPTAAGFSLISLDTSQYTVANSGGGTWTVTLLHPDTPPSKIAVELTYPTSYTTDGGKFTLDFSQQVSYDGLIYDLHNKLVAHIKEVHSAADLTESDINPNDTTKTAQVAVLPSNGVPNLVHVSGDNNTIYGGIADDTISTPATAISSTTNTTFDGGNGVDTVDYSNDTADLTVNLRTNVNHGGSAEGSVLSNVEVIKGGSGNDTLTGNATTSTTMYGGSGNDLMAGGTAGDTFDGGAGSDTVTYAGSATAVTIDLTGVGSNAGGAAGDKFINIERVVGSTLADTFIGGTPSGSATMDGGGGADWIDYSAVSNTRGVTVDLVNNDNNGGGAIYDRLTAIPNIRGSSYNDLFYADGTANSFDGGDGTDVVSYVESGAAGVTVDQSTTTNSAGFAAGDSYTNIESIVGTTGTDTFIGATATGSATMVGNGGTDWVSYQYATSAATLDLTDNTQNGGAASFDRLSGIENVIGSTLDDLFYADSAANSFSGGGGTDVVSYDRATSGLTVDQTGGGHGSGYALGDRFTGIATIVGSALNDTFIGGSTSAGAATMDGAGGSNWVSYQYATSGATVDLTLNTTTSANGGSALYDHLINIENIRGSTLSDTFYADSAANIFSGGGGAGLDVVSYTRSAVGLTIDLTGGGAGTGYASGDGYSGIASVVGSTGADTFIGGTAANSATMVGGGGADWIDYSGLSVTNNYGVTVDLVTTSNNARGALFDRLSDIPNIRGSSGYDLFYANGVANSFDGGDGIDVVSYAQSPGGVTVDQSTTTNSTGYAAGDSYTNIESIVGTTGTDTFIGGTASGSATMVGNGGTDWVSYQYASSGATLDLTDNTQNGGAASFDRLSGIENIVGSSLADTFYADNRANSFDGGDGTDIVSYVRNGTVALTVDQTSGNHGTGYAAGDKYLNIESIVGTTGADTFIGGTATGSATMVGNGGADWASYQYATSGATVDLTNTANNAGAALYDRLSGVENILGSTGNDTFIADAAANSLTGNGGTDWVSYNAAASGVTIDLTRNANNGGWAAGDVLSGIENVIGSSYADTFYADSAANSFSSGGGAGADVVSYTRSTAGLTIDQTTGGRGTGSASLDSYAGIASIVGTTGSDTFIGGTATGSATMVGGGGNDWVSYAYVGSSATVTLGAGANTGAAADDHLSGVENIIASSLGDTLTGDSAANSFISGAGADVISGGGGAGIDTVSYALDPNVAHVVNLATNVNTGGAAAGDRLYDIGQVIGGNAGDTLTGNATTSTTLIGGTGADTLAGGSAADSFDGGAGIDIVTYANSATRVIVDQTSGGNGLGYAAGDVYANIETIVGSTGDDTFIGGNATNAATMAGGGGTDWVSYEYATRGATVNLTYNNTTSANGGAAANDHLIGIENVRGSSFADTFVADGLGNTLDGGDGNDWVSYEKLSSPVTINLFTGINGGAALNDHLLNIENVKGTTGSDTFFANAQANIFSGGGGAGLDVVSYDSSTIGLTVDQTSGGRGSGLASGDSYVGIATIVGSSLSDTFIGGTSTGSATMDGAAGANWITYQYASGTVNLNLGTGGNSGVAQYDHLVNVENIIASSSGGTLTGDANANSFIGGVGADAFIGGGGIDVVAYVLSNTGMVVDQTGGNHGTNSASGDSYSGIATIIGSTSIDTFIGGTATNSATMVGGGGSDWVSYQYASSAATLDLSNNTNNRGSALYDRLGGIESVWGSGYNDTFYADGSANSFVGGGGTDVVSYARTGLGVVINQTSTTLSTGFAQGDTYSGIASIVGSAGDDTFIGGTTSATSATMVGGGGTDWVTYANAATAATVDLTNSANNAGAALYDRLSGVENIIGSTAGDTFFADNQVNTFDGGAGTDVVSYAQSTATGVSVDQTAGNHGAGYAAGDKYINIESIVGTTGSDTFFSSNGAASATMVGGGGTDWVSYLYATSAATVDLNNNNTSTANSGSASADHLVGIENIIGSSLGDTFFADSAANSFDGRGGVDIVSYAKSTAAGVTVDQLTTTNSAGYAAGDKYTNIESIVGTAGNDTFFSSNTTASATMVGGGGTDWISYANATSGATVNLNYNNTSTANGGSASADHLVGIENIRGSTSNDTFVADSVVNTLIGNGGTDWVSYSSATSGVTVDLVTNSLNTGWASGDSLTGIDNIIGSSLNDVLYGNANANTFIGGLGQDSFDGRGGNDVVTYATSTLSLVIDQLGNRGYSTNDALGDRFTSIETIIGSTLADTFLGATASGSATMDGAAGINWVSYQYATSGATVDLNNNATSTANSGAALYDHLVNIENIRGSGLSDTFFADSATNSFIGGGGIDVVSYARSTVGLTVNQNATTLSSGFASLDSFSGIATIIGSGLNDTFIGGATSTNAATMDGAVGNNWISYQTATSGATVDLTLNNTTSANGGSALYDHLINIENIRGSTLADTFYADGATNIFSGGGGAGLDVVSYARSTVGLTVDLTGNGRGTGYASLDSYNGIASVVGTAGADTFIGNTGTGSATMVGGGGSDWITYAYATSAATVDLTLNNTTSANGGAALNDHLVNIENVIGSSLGDTFYADSAANSFDGGAGIDIVSYVRSGATGVTVDQNTTTNSLGYALGDRYSNIESIVGTTGADTFIGNTGTGSATMVGGGGSDWISYAYATSAATVDLNNNNTTTANGGAALYDHLVNIENVIGSTLSDTFYADNAANRFSGGGGAGRDVVSYTRSTAGLTIDQTTSTNSTGYASLDSYSGIASIVGTTGTDTFIGGTGAGSATMVGGGGGDWISYAGAASNATVDLATNANNGGKAANDRLSGVENIVASSLGDTLTGDTAANSFMSGAGADVISGGGGAGIDTVSYALNSGTKHVVNLATNVNTGGWAAGDLLYGIGQVIGGNAGDTLTGNASTSTTLIGGSGDDTLAGGSAADSFDGGAGTDIVTYAGSAAGLTINLGTPTSSSGDAQGDILVNIEIVKGSTFDDTFIGGLGAGSPTMDGGGGTDWVSYGLLTGSTGVLVNLTTGTNGGAAASDHLLNIENIIGSKNADTLTGDAMSNTIQAGSGNDTIIGSLGGDYLDGGAGTDLLDFSASTAMKVMLGNLDAGGKDITYYGRTSLADGFTGFGKTSDGKIDYYVNIENVIGSASDDTLIGNSALNTIMGGSGDDTIGSGGGGDTLDGESGTNTLTYGWSSQGVRVYMAGTDQTNASVSGLSLTGTYKGGALIGSTVVDRFANFGAVIGSAYADTIVGTTGADTIIGNGGADVIYGMGGNDVFYGVAGKGNETLDGGTGTDTVDYTDVRSGVTADLSSATNTVHDSGGRFTDTLVNIENVTGDLANSNTLIGGTGANVLIGGNLNDLLSGGGTTSGIDTLLGKAGDDSFIGGMGTESLDGGVGIDTADYSAVTSAATFNLNSGTATGTTFSDTLINIEAIIGTSLNDVFTGGGGGWSLFGGLGNDSFTMTSTQLAGLSTSGGTLDGGGGSDTLTCAGGDLHAVSSFITNIETVDVHNGVSNSITLTASDIQNIVGSGTNSDLTFTIDSSDSFSITLTGTQTSAVTGTHYAIYSDATQDAAHQIAQLELHKV